MTATASQADDAKRPVSPITRADQFFQKRLRNAEPEVLDEDTTAGDITDILRRLKFDVDNPCAVIGIDRGVRNYLLGLLTAAHRK